VAVPRLTLDPPVGFLVVSDGASWCLMHRSAEDRVGRADRIHARGLGARSPARRRDRETGGRGRDSRRAGRCAPGISNGRS